MCIINNSRKFIFVHVPKAAGTSVTDALSGLTNYCDLELGGTPFGEKIQTAYRDRFGLSKHSTASEIKAVVGAVLWSSYFTFAFVRNPFARCVSTFHFLRKWEGPNTEFLDQMRGFKDFDEYVLSDVWNTSNGPDQIFRPQAYWLRSTTGTAQQLLPSYLGKVESLKAGITDVLSAIDAPKHMIKKVNVRKLNSSGSPSDVVSKNSEVIDRILEKYKVDFQLLGYSTDPLLADAAS